MQTLIDGIITGWQYMSGWELTAVLLAVAYLLLVMRENIWCWPAAFFSTMIYTVLFWESALLMESVLNGYYLLMAVYGWYAWTHAGKDSALSNTDGSQRAITSWSAGRHVRIIGVLALASLAIGFLMANYTHADFAYLDAATTVFSVFATYLVAQKILENWLYWLVIDAASIYLFLNKGFYLTAVLFAGYCVLAVAGYLQWRKQCHKLQVATV